MGISPPSRHAGSRPSACERSREIR
jgi:hypothetical protein